MSIDSSDKWNKISSRKRSGVLVPLFSIYSKESTGIGDFSDLKLLIDWASITGNSIIQLLPMNEVGPVFCPYDSLSAFALEPSYITLRNLPASDSASIKKKINNLKEKFPLDSFYVDYGVRKAKENILRDIFNFNTIDKLNELNKFTEENSYWLNDFALFKALKEFHKESPWFDWQDEFKYRDKSAIERFRAEHKSEIAFQMWLQWQLYLQFKDVKAYAASKGVLLKGDLPILVSRDSADVWQHPEFFKLEFVSGAPPDMYCAKGQRWGMPPYNWEQINADGFRYIAEKLKYAQNFYDLLRIDHVVGVFRIWSIPFDEPLDNQGLNGFFDPRDENLWAGQGRGILEKMLCNTSMLLCAEDLGTIPRVCTDTLKEFGIPGNDVQRWVKDWNVRHDFLLPQEYRNLSVAMLSTHDTTNWPAWWEYEAGTVDEALFVRKCNDRAIAFDKVKKELFNLHFSHHGRLRWKNSIDSIEKLVCILGKRHEEVGDFIEMYQNTFMEKEKLWELFGLSKTMRESCDASIIKEAFKYILESNAVFCINNIFDLFFLSTDSLIENPYQYRINTPGTITNKNWSIVSPMPLEKLLEHKINKEIRSLIKSSGRL